MAYTADDLTAIERLIAGGVEEVRFSDGRTVRNASMKDLMAIRADIRNSLVTGSSRPVVRQIRISTGKGF